MQSTDADLSFTFCMNKIHECPQPILVQQIYRPKYFFLEYGTMNIQNCDPIFEVDLGWK